MRQHDWSEPIAAPQSFAIFWQHACRVDPCAGIMQASVGPMVCTIRTITNHSALILSRLMLKPATLSATIVRSMIQKRMTVIHITQHLTALVAVN
jgi:hypothetical protein